MNRIQGRTVLITGGASGIGYMMGRIFLEEGAAHLVIWDIQKEAADRVVEEFAALGHKATFYQVDLTNPDEIDKAAQAMEADLITPGIVVNNAGIIVGKAFIDHSGNDIERTMQVNALAPMQVARVFLPGMQARGFGHIVNIASAAGLVSNPLMSVYCASKWAVIGWSDSLRIEMEKANTGISVTTVAPYYIDTGMFAGVHSPVIPILRPEYVARRIVAAVKAGKIMLRLPRIVNFVPLLRAVLPMRWFDKIAGDWLGIYHSMRHFKGRNG